MKSINGYNNSGANIFRWVTSRQYGYVIAIVTIFGNRKTAILCTYYILTNLLTIFGYLILHNMQAEIKHIIYLTLYCSVVHAKLKVEKNK